MKTILKKTAKFLSLGKAGVGFKEEWSLVQELLVQDQY